MLNSRPQPAPLDPTVRVVTASPFPNRLGMPCIACGSPVDLEQVYCPNCRRQIVLQAGRRSMRIESLERELAEVA